MRKEEIVNFASKIIADGVESDLGEIKIKETLEKYKNYLISQSYIDDDSLKTLNNVIATSSELTKLANVYGSNGIAGLILNRENKKSEQKVDPNVVTIPKSLVETDRCGNVVHDRCGNPIPKTNYTSSRCGSVSRDRCGVSSTTVTSSGCGGGRSLGRSSC